MAADESQNYANDIEVMKTFAGIVNAQTVLETARREVAAITEELAGYILKQIRDYDGTQILRRSFESNDYHSNRDENTYSDARLWVRT